MRVNRPLSELAAYFAIAMPRQCWRNAWRAWTETEELREDLQDALYVEGWAIYRDARFGLPFEHGWLELYGEIIDLTLWQYRVVYFPGLRFDRETAMKEVSKETSAQKPGQLPIAWRYGRGGCDSREYNRAFRDAHDFVLTQEFYWEAYTRW